MSATEAPTLDETRANQLSSAFNAIRDNIQRVVRGKQEVVEQALLCLLAGGHLLLEDVPGVGKMAGIADPTGAMCMIMQPAPQD